MKQRQIWRRHRRRHKRHIHLGEAETSARQQEQQQATLFAGKVDA